MLKYIPAFLTTLLALPGIIPDAAAQKNETVNKTITKDLPVSPEDVLAITGEKASIHITGWDHHYIRVKITFSATHTDRKTASRELAFMQYALSREGNTVELRNAFILPSSTDNIQSTLEVLIEINMPAANQLSLKNKYGDAAIRGMYGKIRADIEFGDMEISDIRGELMLRSSFSEIRGDRIAASSFRCQDEKSQLFLDLGAGTCSFNSRHSDLDLSVKNITSLQVESSRTNITIRPEHPDTYRYRLVNKEGKIYVPELYAQQVKKEGKQSSLFVDINTTKPLIQLTTTFNTITIK